MPTIFGPEWLDLTLDDVRAYLDAADDEPLLWEANGTSLDPREVRRQVCAFANNHDGGYLILGAHRPPATDDEPEPRWVLDGLQFPDEPRPWISNVVTDLAVGVRPRPDFDVAPWDAPNGHVVVVRVTSTSTPPCMANGTVYERLPGKSQTVRDPLRLADLFARGDAAHRGAQARADETARTVLVDWLSGDAGRFAPVWELVEPDEGDDPAEADDETAFVRFAVGVAATGNPPDISSRLFRAAFMEEVWTALRDRPTGIPAGFRRPPDPVTVAQDSLTWRHHAVGMLDTLTVVRATWDGATACGVKLATEDANPDSLASARIGPAWQRADDLVRTLGGFGDVYVTVLVAGGRFPRRVDDGYIVIRRGPMLPGVDEDQVASIGRELLRAVGNLAEP